MTCPKSEEEKQAEEDFLKNPPNWLKNKLNHPYYSREYDNPQYFNVKKDVIGNKVRTEVTYKGMTYVTEEIIQ